MIETNMQFSDIYQALADLASQEEINKPPIRKLVTLKKNE